MAFIPIYLMNFFKNNYRLFKSALKKLTIFFIYIKRTSENYKISKEKPSAIINWDRRLMPVDSGRYFYILCIYFSYCRFNVVVNLNVQFFKSMKRYQKLLLKEKFQFIRNASSPINTITLRSPKHSNKVINISYGYNRVDTESFDCIAPYPMHPWRYLPFSNLNQTAKNRELKRNIKIFFSGNVNENKYQEESMGKEFDVLPRWEVINFIKTNFEKSGKIHLVSDKTVLYNLIHSKSYINSIIITQARTDPKDWLEILGKINFFICPPGSSSPWCHNSIEAMSVGTIPILQYAELFTPALINKKNCLHYTSYDSLRQAIEEALEMKEEEIKIMQSNVINYFDRYLSIESIAKKIDEFSKSDKEKININIPYITSLKINNNM